jgi:hypothetical protein
MTDEVKARIALAHIGLKASSEARGKMSAAHIRCPSGREGCHLSDEQRQRVSIAHTGYVMPPETRAKIAATTLGRRKSDAMRAKVSAAQLGTANSVWKGGKRAWIRKHAAKRRLLGFFPLNEPFPECEGHHVNKDHVLFIPSVLHGSVPHNVWTGKNMDKINALAGAYLTEDWT